MRYKQDEVIQNLEADMENRSEKSETTQYIITSICTGLVFLSLISITPIFNWVIKDKSYVIAIFSDIEQDEIRKVISECKKMDIRNVYYQNDWTEKYENAQNEFWQNLVGSRHHEDRITKDLSKDLGEKPVINLMDKNVLSSIPEITPRKVEDPVSEPKNINESSSVNNEDNEDAESSKERKTEESPDDLVKHTRKEVENNEPEIVNDYGINLQKHLQMLAKNRRKLLSEPEYFSI